MDYSYGSFLHCIDTILDLINKHDASQTAERDANFESLLFPNQLLNTCYAGILTYTTETNFHTAIPMYLKKILFKYSQIAPYITILI